MFEKKFLAYILYATLLEIRESAYKEKNSRIFHLTDMLHNVPTSLLEDEAAKEDYKKVLQSVESLKIFEWFNNRIMEFKKRFPEFEDQFPAETDIKEN